MLSQAPRNRPTQDVLQYGDDEREDEKREDERTAAAQQREAGGEADRREERILRWHLQRGVELYRLDAGEIEDGEQSCDGKTAAHRRGDVDLAEDRNQSPDAVAGKEDRAGKCNGLNEIEGDRQHEPCSLDFAQSSTAAKRG